MSKNIDNNENTKQSTPLENNQFKDVNGGGAFTSWCKDQAESFSHAYHLEEGSELLKEGLKKSGEKINDDFIKHIKPKWDEDGLVLLDYS